MRVRGILGAAALALAAAGCTSVFRAYDLAPNGLHRPEEELRRALAFATASAGDAGRVERSLARAAPEDDLLRMLYLGLVAYQRGRWEESTRAFEAAGLLAEDRYTRSLSRSAFSLVSSDRILPYEPPATERLLIPYYAALGYLAMGDAEGAAVEARRLSWQLQREADRTAPTGAAARTHAFLRYFAGVLFEAAGEWSDADVAYRNAAALASDALPAWVEGEHALRAAAADERPGAAARRRAAAGTGEIIVVFESGFVAHRVEQSLHIWLAPHEVDLLTGGGAAEKGTTAATVAARAIGHALDPERALHDPRARRTIRIGSPETARATRPPPRQAGMAPRGAGEAAADPRPAAGAASPIAVRDSGASARAGGAVQDTAAARAQRAKDEKKKEPSTTPYLMRIAWPMLFQERRGPLEAAALVAAGGGDATLRVPVTLGADVTRALAAELAAQRTQILARTIVRASSKMALSRGAQQLAGKRDDGLGELVGVLANLGTAALEQADTRSWHLLPSEFGLARLQVPAGRHPVIVEVAAAAGQPARRIDLGVVDVAAGEIRVLHARSWH
jgi:hypothetical protein